MLNRNELLQSLTMLMIDQGHALSDAQAQLSKLSTTELELHFARAINAGTLNSDGSLKKSVPPTATWADVERAKQELQRDRERAEETRLDQQLRSDAAVAAQNTLREIRERDRLEPQDRNIFADAARVLRNFALIDANFSLLRSTLGPGNLSVYSIKRAIESKQVSLVPVTEEQLAEYQRDDVEQHNAALLAATTQQLREYARQEGQQRRALVTQQAEKELLENMAKRDSYRGFPELPREMADGTVLDSIFFKRLPTDRLKYFIKRFGPSQISNRINNR